MADLVFGAWTEEYCRESVWAYVWFVRQPDPMTAWQTCQEPAWLMWYILRRWGHMEAVRRRMLFVIRAALDYYHIPEEAEPIRDYLRSLLYTAGTGHRSLPSVHAELSRMRRLGIPREVFDICELVDYAVFHLKIMSYPDRHCGDMMTRVANDWAAGIVRLMGPHVDMDALCDVIRNLFPVRME